VAVYKCTESQLINRLTDCQSKKIANPKAGGYLGAKAGLILGIWLLIASAIQGILLLPASGQSTVSLFGCMPGGRVEGNVAHTYCY
jgi:hypothetical protein